MDAFHRANGQRHFAETGLGAWIGGFDWGILRGRLWRAGEKRDQRAR
jgi:hypothetical protein